MTSSTNKVTAAETASDNVNDTAQVEETSTAPFPDGRRRSRRLLSVKKVIMTEVDEFVDEGDDQEEVEVKDEGYQQASNGPSPTQPKAKKRRKNQSTEVDNAIKMPKKILYNEATDYKIDFDLLCGGIIQIIYGFLSTSRNLSNLSQCSKRLRSLVSYEHVIRSAVFGPKKESRKTIENIVARVGDRFMFVPSVQRLLRLVNGKRCERGDDCWRYNLETKKAPVVSYFNDTGISLCYGCFDGLFHVIKGEMRNWSLSENRKLYNNFCGPLVPAIPFTERATREFVGPYVTMMTYQQLHSTYYASRWAPDEEKKKSAQRLAEGLKQAFETQRSSDPNYAKGELFAGILAEAKIDLEIRNESAYNQSAEQRKQRNKHKFNKVQHIHQCLVEAVGEMEGKDTILDCVWNNPNDSWYSRYCTPVQYSCTLTKALMGRLVSAPASASKKIIKNATEHICQVFESFSENDFFSLSFFDQEGSRWDRALHNLCIEKVNSANFWTKVEVGPSFLSMVSEGRFQDVLSHYLQSRQKKPILSEVFARLVHDNEPSSHEFFSEQEFRLLAQNYCVKFCGRQSIAGQPLTLIELKENLESKSVRYLSMKQDLVSLLGTEQFRSFVEGYNRPWELSNFIVFKRSIINVPPENNIDVDSFVSDLRQRASHQNRGRYQDRQFLREI